MLAAPTAKEVVQDQDPAPLLFSHGVAVEKLRRSWIRNGLALHLECLYACYRVLETNVALIINMIQYSFKLRMMYNKQSHGNEIGHFLS